MPLYGQSAQNSQPLDESEKRRVLAQLIELRSCRASVGAYEEYLKREAEQDVKERGLADRALELEKQVTALAQRERDLAQEKAAMYEQLYKSVTKKPGFGCRLLKVVTLGMSGCH